MARKLANQKPSIEWNEQPLGHGPDEELAASLGVSTSSVARQRRQRGIKHFTPTPILRGEKLASQKGWE
jgi:hypothetical protein